MIRKKREAAFLATNAWRLREDHPQDEKKKRDVDSSRFSAPV